MHTAIGVFSAREEAHAAFQELLRREVPQDEIVFLCRSEAEDSNATESGVTIGGLVRFAAGMSAAVLLVVPGIGPVVALGFGAAALLGLAGTGTGAGLAKTTVSGAAVPSLPEEKCSEDVAFFRDVLAEGRSLVVVRTESKDVVNLANEVFNRLGIAMQEQKPVRLQVSHRKVADIVIVEVRGRITVGDGSVVLRELVRELADNGTKKVLFNLRHVAYIDSSGLGELVMAYTTLRNRDGQLRLVDVNKKVYDLLRMTKLHLVLDVESDEASAIQSFGASPTSSARGEASPESASGPATDS